MRRDIHNSALPVLCLTCEARYNGICGALEPTQLPQLGRRAVRREVSPGTELLSAGVRVDGYANILSGVVKLTKVMPDGRQQIVGLQFAPAFLGRPFETSNEISAEAVSTVRLCSFPKSTLEKIVRQSPDLLHRLHKQSLRELDEAREWMLILGQKTASEKVASFLLFLSFHINPEVDGYSSSFDVALKRTEIANFLGLTVETVSRHLTLFRKDKTISIKKNRHIEVLNYRALESAAGT